MTRPKVPDDRRQRTAQACDSCKRRKQKCNGLTPCNTCIKRTLPCTYTVPPVQASSQAQDSGETGLGGPPAKRRRLGGDSETPEMDTTIPHKLGNTSPSAKKGDESAARDLDKGKAKEDLPKSEPHTRHLTLPATDLEARSRRSTTAGVDDEAEVFTEVRMLEDPAGRLLYLGDSSTLSYLQFVRMVVEISAGPSAFTKDPSRHRLMEMNCPLPVYLPLPSMLPDRRTADILVESYFINSSGILEVFGRKAFLRTVDACYSDPLSADNSFLCLLNLTFAIGLVLATPREGSEEHAVIARLRSGKLDHAELFLRSARAFGDPISGFEDGDFWSVQALVLMAVYMLARTKRNAAYAYHGMAVRSAFSLGLHRQETMVIFSHAEGAVRRNLWRSLYILDRYLSASLGRPAAISDDDCSRELLTAPEGPDVDDGNLTERAGIEAAIRSCRMISVILKSVYTRKKISVKLAQDVASMGKRSAQQNHPNLHHQRLKQSLPPSEGLTILHTNLLYYHAIILLTRPFMLYIINALRQAQTGAGQAAVGLLMDKYQKYTEACISSSYHTIWTVQLAYEGKYLPQRNPFVIHFLFAATLIIQSNEFAALYRQPAYPDTIAKAIEIMEYCAEADPQAKRLLFILKSFWDVIAARPAQPRPTAATFPALSRDQDPIGSLSLQGGLMGGPSPALAAASRQSVASASRISAVASAGLGPPPAAAFASRGAGKISGLPSEPIQDHLTGPRIPRSLGLELPPTEPAVAFGPEPSSAAEEIDFGNIWQGWGLAGAPPFGTGLSQAGVLGLTAMAAIPNYALYSANSAGHARNGLDTSSPLYPLQEP